MESDQQTEARRWIEGWERAGGRLCYLADGSGLCWRLRRRDRERSTLEQDGVDRFGHVACLPAKPPLSISPPLYLPTR